jgi:hypothetical protein
MPVMWVLVAASTICAGSSPSSKRPFNCYFLELSKRSILVIREHNQATAKSAFAEFDFKVWTRYHYLGSFFGLMDDQTAWIDS